MRARTSHVGTHVRSHELSARARAIIDAILDGSIDKAETIQLPIFNLEVPTALHDVDSGVLDPRQTYADLTEWTEKATRLASMFVENFRQFTDNEDGKALVAAGPTLG